MALASRLQPADTEGRKTAISAPAAEGEAQALAARLPDLLIDAMRVSNTIVHGIHGRRRSGPGETFWQFRQYETTDDARLIDWRRSASSDHYFVREREWEAAHTFWLWANVSESMLFRSHLAGVFKRDRALVLLLGLCELLVRSGERVAFLGLSRPSASRRTTVRLAETLGLHENDPILDKSLPEASHNISRHSGVVLIGDFLEPAGETIARMQALAANGASGHVVMVLDPAEETLPYKGRAEFLGVSRGETWIADRVESIRDDYIAKLKSHRDQIKEQAQRLGWSFVVHHTDATAAEPLLQLIMRLQDGRGQGDGGFNARARGVI